MKSKTNGAKPTDLITTTTAREPLGISTRKMAGLIEEGRIRTYADPLDKRVKLISRARVLALRVRAEASSNSQREAR